MWNRTRCSAQPPLPQTWNPSDPPMFPPTKSHQIPTRTNHTKLILFNLFIYCRCCLSRGHCRASCSCFAMLWAGGFLWFHASQITTLSWSWWWCLLHFWASRQTKLCHCHSLHSSTQALQLWPMLLQWTCSLMMCHPLMLLSLLQVWPFQFLVLLKLAPWQSEGNSIGHSVNLSWWIIRFSTHGGPTQPNCHLSCISSSIPLLLELAIEDLVWDCI